MKTPVEVRNEIITRLGVYLAEHATVKPVDFMSMVTWNLKGSPSLMLAVSGLKPHSFQYDNDVIQLRLIITHEHDGERVSEQQAADTVLELLHLVMRWWRVCGQTRLHGFWEQIIWKNFSKQKTLPIEPRRKNVEIIWEVVPS